MPKAEVVVGLFEEGVAGFERSAATVDAREDWDAPACGAWTAADTARHVLAVVRWYHSWLDRAETGLTTPPFPATELDERNAAELDALREVSGPDATEAFAAEARHYIQRVRAQFDRPYGYPFGTVTAGLHAGVAATEWHLHAWDLPDRSHMPADPAALFRAAGACFTSAEGGLKGTVLGLLVPLGARRHPWESLLRRSGRLAR